MNQDVLDICTKLDKNPQDIIINSYKSKKKITYYEMVEALLISGSTTASATYLEVTYRTINRATAKFELSKLNGGNETFKYKLLSLIDKKECHVCGQIKSIDEFHRDKSANTGKSARCKDCKSVDQKKWYDAHSEQHNLNTTARMRSLDRQLTTKEVQFVFDRDNYKCCNCGLTNEEHLINHGQRLHLDHIVAVSKGGLTIINNIQLLCRSCNSSKSNADMVE